MKLLQTTFIAALLLSGTTFAQNRDNDEPYRTQNFSGNINTVRVQTSGGSITVEGGQGSGAKVEMFVRANNWNDKLDKAEIEDRLKDYEVSIKTEGNTVIASAERIRDKNDWKRGLSISFKVYSPKSVTTDLKTSGGSIRIAHLNGQQNFATSGGSLHLTDVEGTVKGRTSGGSITAEDCRKNIDLSTSGGSITARNSSGDLHLRTSGGSIKLEALKGQVDARTSGGSITAEGVSGELNTGTSGGSIRLRDIAGSVRAETSGGGIEADITKLGEYVRLSTSAGSVRVRMPMDKGMNLDLSGNRVSTGALSKFDGSMERDRVKGQLNGGGIPVQISANSGSVYLNQN